MESKRLPEDLDILGIRYKIEQVPCVNKFEPRKGEVDFLANVIRIDENMPEDMKVQTLIHEVLHCLCDAFGLYDLNENETAIQSLATGLYYIFVHTGIEVTINENLKSRIKAPIYIGDRKLDEIYIEKEDGKNAE